jgi:hypothetical protein
MRHALCMFGDGRSARASARGVRRAGAASIKSFGGHKMQMMWAPLVIYANAKLDDLQCAL